MSGDAESSSKNYEVWNSNLKGMVNSFCVVKIDEQDERTQWMTYETYRCKFLATSEQSSEADVEFTAILRNINIHYISDDYHSAVSKTVTITLEKRFCIDIPLFESKNDYDHWMSNGKTGVVKVFSGRTDVELTSLWNTYTDQQLKLLLDALKKKKPVRIKGRLHFYHGYDKEKETFKPWMYIYPHAIDNEEIRGK